MVECAFEGSPSEGSAHARTLPWQGIGVRVKCAFVGMSGKAPRIPLPPGHASGFKGEVRLFLGLAPVDFAQTKTLPGQAMGAGVKCAFGGMSRRRASHIPLCLPGHEAGARGEVCLFSGIGLRRFRTYQDVAWPDTSGQGWSALF